MSGQQFPQHVQRMVAESEELLAKCQRLSAFVDADPMFRTLPEDEQILLCRQQEAMNLYLFILQQRLAAAGVP